MLDNMEETGRSRKLAGKALLVFIVIMLALTWSGKILENMTIATVSTASVSRGALEKQISASGSLEAKSIIPAYSDYAARVVSNIASVGSSVGVGDPLIVIDCADALKAKADAVKSAQNDTRSKQQALNYVISDMSAQAKGRADNRMAKLADIDAQIEAAQKRGDADEAESLRLRYNEEKARLDAETAARDYVNKSDALATSKEALDTAQAEYDELAALADERGYVTITSALAGIVTQMPVQVGNAINAGGVAAMICDSASGLSLTISVDEDQAADLLVGDSARVYVGGSEYSCRIESMALTENGSFRLAFTLPGDAGAVGANATVRISKRTDSYDNVIPLSALRSDSDGDFVYVVEQQNSSLGNSLTVQRRSVTVINSDANRAAVSGVSQRDLLAARSDRSISAGSRVRLESE